MRHAALSATLFAAYASAYVVDSASFGQAGTIAPEGHIKNWLLTGEGYIPELLSDKIILTPPGPGKVQGAAWMEKRFPAPDWLVDFEFRASGPDHANGQLQIWYTRENQAGIGTRNLYSVGKFTGLAILIDPLGGRGGGIRAFLNDGTTDFSKSDVSTLPFGHCDYSYRNLGRPSKIQLHQDASGLELLVDGQRCFKADGVSLPGDNYFGITANTGETPDSFELFKFVAQTGLSFQREEPGSQQQAMGNPPSQQNEQPKLATAPPPRVMGTPDSPMLNDIHEHARLLSERVPAGFKQLQDKADSLASQCATKSELKALEAKIDRLQTLMEKVSNEQRDWSGHFRDLQSDLKAGTSSVLGKLPESMESAMTKHGPSTIQFVLIVIAAQLVLGLGYVLYRRRLDSPKKYL